MQDQCFSFQGGWGDAGPSPWTSAAALGRSPRAGTALPCRALPVPRSAAPRDGGCFSSRSARGARHVRSHCSSPVLQQEQDRGALPDGEMLLLPGAGGGDDAGGSLLRGW